MLRYRFERGSHVMTASLVSRAATKVLSTISCLLRNRSQILEERLVCGHSLVLLACGVDMIVEPLTSRCCCA